MGHRLVASAALASVTRDSTFQRRTKSLSCGRRSKSKHTIECCCNGRSCWRRHEETRWHGQYWECLCEDLDKVSTTARLKKGAAAEGEVVAGAHARQHRIHDVQRCLLGRHEGTHLRSAAILNESFRDDLPCAY